MPDETYLYTPTFFFPFAKGSPNIHSLRLRPAEKKNQSNQVLITTDKSLSLLGFDTKKKLYRQTLLALDLDEIMSASFIELPSQHQTLVVAHVDNVHNDNKMLLQVIPSNQIHQLPLAIAPFSSAPTTSLSTSSSSSCLSSIAALPPSSSSPTNRKARANSGAHGINHGTSTPASHALPSLRFEIVSAPTNVFNVHVQASTGEWFHGVLLFRTDSLVAFGFVVPKPDEETTESTATKEPQCVRLNDEQIALFFPEFAHFQHVVISVDLFQTANRSCIAFGCADGFLRIFNKTTTTVVSPGPAASLLWGADPQSNVHCSLDGPFETRDLVLDGPITSVCVFENLRTSQLNVVATCAVGYAMVYEEDLSTGLPDSSSAPCREPQKLVHSDEFGSILSCGVLDIDLDGQKEILLGTSHGKLLAYRQDASLKWHQLESDVWQFESFGGIYSVLCHDINQDGIQEILVASCTGVTVLEINPALVLHRLERVLKLLQEP